MHLQLATILFTGLLFISSWAQSDPIVLKDGFEAGKLSDFWKRGDTGTGRYEEGAVTVQSKIKRSGAFAAKVLVREGDIQQCGHYDGPNLPEFCTERAELDSGKYDFYGKEVEYRYSLFLPEDFPIADNRLVLASWKHNMDESPVLSQRLQKDPNNEKDQSGIHRFEVRVPKGKTKFKLPSLEKGKWHDFVVRVVFSGDPKKGSVKIWMNGKDVLSYDGQTAYPNINSPIHNKLGLYRNQWPEPMTLYLDDYELREIKRIESPGTRN